jgi:hypothetical protein
MFANRPLACIGHANESWKFNLNNIQNLYIGLPGMPGDMGNGI